MADVFAIDGVRYVFSECISCGIRYAVVERLWDQQRQQGGFHHCPNGHLQGWNKEDTLFEQQRRELERAKQQIARAEDEKHAAEKRAFAAEKAAKKIKRRAEAALCPCCNRHFAQLERHMKSQHPDVVKLPARALP